MLTAVPNPAAAGQTANLNATLTDTVGVQPTDRVEFFNGSTILGKVTPVSAALRARHAGTATTTARRPAAGSDGVPPLIGSMKPPRTSVSGPAIEATPYHAATRTAYVPCLIDLTLPPE